MWRTLLDYKIASEPLAQQLSERYLEILPTKKQLFTDSLEVLDYLQGKKYPLHLITNGFEKTQMAKLENSGIRPYFTHIITSEAAGIMKPHAAIFEYALQMTGATTTGSIMIGDTLEADIVGGNNAGIDTVYFNPNNEPAGKIQPTFTIQSLSELKKIL
jgi:putative hydrolase of the HAD superfamily